MKRGSAVLGEKHVDDEERERKRKAIKERREKEAFDEAIRLRDQINMQTLLELAEGDMNPEAAQDEINERTYHYALGFDILALYLNVTAGFPAPMAYDDEKKQLMEQNPQFNVRFKVESDE